MAGVINRLPYPDDKMTDVIRVKKQGNILLLTEPDAHIQTFSADPPRASQAGDTLSRQPDGSWQGRPGVVVAPFEVFVQNGSLVVYHQGKDYDGKPEGFLYWEIPNA